MPARRAPCYGVPMLLVVALAHAGPYPVANPGRPSFSDNASPVETGALEIEAGAAVDPEAAGLNYALKLGVHPDATLRLGLDHLVYPGAEIGTGNLSAKFTLRHPDAGRLGVALAPFAAYDLSSSVPGFGVNLIGTLPFGPFQLDANALADAQYLHDRSVTLAVDPVLTLGLGLGERFGIYAESYAIVPVLGETEGLGLAAAGGLGFAFRPDLVLDAGCDVGLMGLPRWTAQLGVTWAGWVAKDSPMKTPSPRPRSPR